MLRKRANIIYRGDNTKGDLRVQDALKKFQTETETQRCASSRTRLRLRLRIDLFRDQDWLWDSEHLYHKTESLSLVGMSRGKWSILRVLQTTAALRTCLHMMFQTCNAITSSKAKRISPECLLPLHLHSPIASQQSVDIHTVDNVECRQAHWKRTSYFGCKTWSKCKNKHTFVPGPQKVLS